MAYKKKYSQTEGGWSPSEATRGGLSAKRGTFLSGGSYGWEPGHQPGSGRTTWEGPAWRLSQGKFGIFGRTPKSYRREKEIIDKRKAVETSAKTAAGKQFQYATDPFGIGASETELGKGFVESYGTDLLSSDIQGKNLKKKCMTQILNFLILLMKIQIILLEKV